MLPFSPSAPRSEVMNSRRGSLPSVARNSSVRVQRQAVAARGLTIGKGVDRTDAFPRTSGLRIHAFKIREIKRVLQALQLLAEFGAQPRLSHLHTRSRTPLSLTEREIIRYVEDGLDAHFLQFLGGTGMESWQIPDVVIWERRIAAVEELAGDRDRCNAAQLESRAGSASQGREVPTVTGT